MDEFMNVLDELSVATEALSGNMKSDYKAISKSASATIRSAKKAMKAGNYDEASKMCDEAITEIKAFQAALNSSDRGEARGEEGEATDEGGGSKFAAVKAIVVAVLSALAAVAIVKGVSKAATSKPVTSAQAKMNMVNVKARNKADAAKMDYYNKKADKLLNKRKGNFDKLEKASSKADMAETRMMHSRAATADDYATANKAATAKFAGKKGAAMAAGVGAVGASVVQALKAFITAKNSSPEAMNKALDASIKSLEAIKAACKEARSAANESAMEEPSTMNEFFNGVFDEIFTDANESFIMDMVECGIDDLTACEMYVDFILPELYAWD